MRGRLAASYGKECGETPVESSDDRWRRRWMEIPVGLSVQRGAMRKQSDGAWRGLTSSWREEVVLCF